MPSWSFSPKSALDSLTFQQRSIVIHSHWLCLWKSYPDSLVLMSFLSLILFVSSAKSCSPRTCMMTPSWAFSPGLMASLLVVCLFTFTDLRSSYPLWFCADLFLSILSHLFTQLPLLLCANASCKSPLFCLISLYSAQMSDAICDLFFWTSHSKHKFNITFSAFLLYKSFQWNQLYEPMGRADFFWGFHRKNAKKPIHEKFGSLWEMLWQSATLIRLLWFVFFSS